MRVSIIALVLNRWAKRLLNAMIIDCAKPGEEVDMAIKIFSSVISDYISNFNSDCYYQNPSYLEESFKAGELL